VLSFWHRYVTEAGWDYCHVEISTDGGSTWPRSRLRRQPDHLQQVTIPVPQLDGIANARVRFRLTSDTNTVADGCTWTTSWCRRWSCRRLGANGIRHRHRAAAPASAGGASP